MAWSLEIHHIDVDQGDSTLIVAKNDGVGPNQLAQTRAILIDGGEKEQGHEVHKYVVAPSPLGAGLGKVDVMVATHYDKDHYWGLIAILKDPTYHQYDSVICYDQGEQGDLEIKRSRNALGYKINFSNQDNKFREYSKAVKRVATRTRLTEKVANANFANLALAGYVEPNTWLNKEIMWRDENGHVLNPGHFLEPHVLGASNPNTVNLHPPTVTVIAVNGYIRGHHRHLAVLGGSADPKNHKSIAVLIEFNNFKYYLGGDLERPQENVMMQHLTAAGNPNDRILAMKASHHGAHTSTPPGFVNRLRPAAAFISSGYKNNHTHPRDVTLNQLEACPTLNHYYMSNDRSLAEWALRVGGVQDDPVNPGAVIANPAFPPQPVYTAKAVVVGAWSREGDGVGGASNRYGDSSPVRVEGNSVLKVTEAQSMEPLAGALLPGRSRFTVTYYHATSVPPVPPADFWTTDHHH